MNYTEADYINAGHRFELGQIPAQSLRMMLESETLDFRAEARRLIAAAIVALIAAAWDL